MIREIVFVDSEKVGFIVADQAAQGTLLKPKFIRVGDIIELEDGNYKVAAISSGDDAGDYGDLCVFRLNEGLQDIVSPFDVANVYRKVAP